MKSVLFLALILATAPALAQPAEPAKIAVSVTPLPVETSDIADFFAIQSWRFKMEAPNASPKTLLSRRLELRVPNQNPVVLSSSGTEIGDAKSMELLIMMRPEGESLTTAPKLWTRDKFTHFDAQGNRQGSDAANSLNSNPLKNLETAGYQADHFSTPDENGAIVLMTIFLRGKAEEEPLKSQLVLVITTNSEN